MANEDERRKKLSFSCLIRKDRAAYRGASAVVNLAEEIRLLRVMMESLRDDMEHCNGALVVLVMALTREISTQKGPDGLSDMDRMLREAAESVLSSMQVVDRA